MLNTDYPWLSVAHQYMKTLKKSDRLPHALLITGAESMGKFNFAIDALKMLLCPKNGCDKCQFCTLINEDEANKKGVKDLLIRRSHYPHLMYCHREITKTGKLSNYIRIDQIRALCEALTKSADTLQIGLIYYADEFTLGAANNLLKTLEEPRDNTLIMLLAHRYENVPITIRSRCQHIHIANSYSEATQIWLKENIDTLNDGNVEPMLKLANGVPFKVVQWAQDNMLDRHEKWRKKWLEIALNPVKVNDIEVFKDEHIAALSYLQQLLIEAIKLSLTPSKPSDEDALNQIILRADIKHIFQLLQDINHILDLFHSQANQQLLFNTVVIIWSHITHLKTYPRVLPQ